MDFVSLNENQRINIIKKYISNFEETKEKMQESFNYYDYIQDIDKKQRLVIGEDGKLERVNNLPNNKIKDNQFAKVVDQKVSYLFSLPPIIKAEDKNYQYEIQKLYNKRFTRTINKVGLDSILYGITWLYVYLEDNKFKYDLIDSKEVIPIWKDNKHEKLDAVIRNYCVNEIKDGEVVNVIKVKLFTDDLVFSYRLEEGVNYVLESKNSYLKDEKGRDYSFGKIPFIYFKSNNERPLLNRCKSLQDGINMILSNFQDNMLEDKRSAILVLKNYDGENLGEFRQNLAQYGAVKVRDTADGRGGLDALEVNVNSDNYKLILQILKEKLIENCRGIDFKNDKTTQALNELNIKSMYTDIELDSNAMELEFSASLEHFESFYKQVNNIKTESVSTINFKRNIMVNDESTVSMIRNSVGIVSNETLLSVHPFVDNVSEELEKIKEQDKEKIGQEFIIATNKGSHYE